MGSSEKDRKGGDISVKTITLRQLRRAARIIYSARARVLVSLPSHSHSGVPPSRFASSYSCRHFHFHFWLSLRQELPLLCPTVDIIFKFPTVSKRAPLCLSASLLSSLFSFFLCLSPFLPPPFLAARIFFFIFATRRNMRARP